jgi:hypothetical protein
MQPRTLELYDILGVLPEFLKLANTDMGRRRMYELPGGSKVVKELPVADYVEPAPGTPQVRLMRRRKCKPHGVPLVIFFD